MTKFEEKEIHANLEHVSQNVTLCAIELARVSFAVRTNQRSDGSKSFYLTNLV
jgi:hypothetical protein